MYAIILRCSFPISTRRSFGSTWREVMNPTHRIGLVLAWVFLMVLSFSTRILIRTYPVPNRELADLGSFVLLMITGVAAAFCIGSIIELIVEGKPDGSERR